MVNDKAITLNLKANFTTGTGKIQTLKVSSMPGFETVVHISVHDGWNETEKIISSIVLTEEGSRTLLMMLQKIHY